MKKSVLILIIVVYIVSIGVVGFLGLKIQSFYEVVYANDISCETYIYNNTEYNFIDSHLGYLYATVPYSTDIANPTVVWLQSRVFPDETTNKEVIFSYDETRTTAYVDNLGRVFFNKKGVITITVYVEENPTLSVKIKVFAE